MTNVNVDGRDGTE